jgi:hypothetical protein
MAAVDTFSLSRLHSLFSLDAIDVPFQHFLCGERCTNLKKRLQRSRKILLLVKIFRENILHAVPEVSVTRLDSVKLEDLTKLVTGLVETNKVKRILARMTP